MTVDFQIADYAWCGLALVMALLGLFRGFSGSLGFVMATASAMAAAFFGWMYSPALTSVGWQRGAGVLALSLLVFGLVRIVIKKLVNGLLAQPTDAIFGALLGLAIAVALLLFWAHSGAFLEYSFLAKEAAVHVR